MQIRGAHGHRECLVKWDILILSLAIFMQKHRFVEGGVVQCFMSQGAPMPVLLSGYYLSCHT